MKSQYRMLFAFVILLVGISCLCTQSGTPATPTQPPIPTNPPPADTDAPAPTANIPQPPVVDDTPASNGGQQFFTEEFDTSLSNDWSILTVTGSDKADPEKVTVEPQNGKLVWDFDSEYVYYYMFYNVSYTDVTVELQADNRGKNNNSISLICRYDPEVGWYEFNIANNGLYEILYADSSGDSIGYSRITNGGSNEIKQGKDSNEYSISCVDDKLTLTINGDEVNSVTEKKYGLREGGVGMSVSAFNVLPILVDMDWFKVSEP